MFRAIYVEFFSLGAQLNGRSMAVKSKTSLGGATIAPLEFDF